MRPTLPTGFQQPSGISSGAKTILKHFRDKNFSQMVYEYPVNLAALFDDPEQCEVAQAELEQLGYIDLGPAPPQHIPVRNRVRAAALTLEGERYIQKNDLGD